MEETLIFIEQRQAWIYALLAVAGLVYLRLALRNYQELRRAQFGLERERALEGLRRDGAMLALVVAAGVATFVIATFVSPAIPGSNLPTPMPTVSLLSTPQGATAAVESGFESATPLPAGGVDSSGCLNPNATLTFPESGSSLSGIVQVRGTADIPDFGFYKLEYRSLSEGSAWRAISAGDKPIVDDRLAEWDTSLVLPGEYAFRLVVADTAGNAPLPCVIAIRVVPTP